jgi:hypothetical protein
MEKEFISYEQALSLKELGFDEKCLAWYNPKKFIFAAELGFIKNSENWLLLNQCAAPLRQQAFDWFREKHNLDSWIYCPDESKGYFAIILKHKRFVSYHENFDTYEETELACLNKLIEIVKNGNKS